ncbi:9141_t:CDS:2 [Entrophospora sp. SA101]|nr:9141_t:CDS:2 [Entrophospora sp. SA101]
MSKSIKSLKRALRTETRELLSKIPLDVIEQESLIVTRRLLSIKEYQNSKKVSIYLSTPNSEISTKAIIKDIFDKEKICYVPRCNGDYMEMVRLKSYQDYLSLPLNRWNIPEPNLDEKLELDLIIMPGLAFDIERNRLGHGKGYYDKFLANCQKLSIENKKNLPITIAIVLESQILKKIPTTNYDIKPDIVLTHNQIFTKD